MESRCASTSPYIINRYDTKVT